MKICLYSPYIPKHTGGGEMYLLQVAQSLLEQSHQVYLAVGDDNGRAKSEIIDHYQKAFNLNLSGLEIVESPLGGARAFWRRWLFTAQFDVFYYLTDGSIFPSFSSHKNILHVQFPFGTKKNLWDQLKLKSWQVKNTNSEFTRKVIESSWPTKIDLVHSPFVEIDGPKKALKKEKIILHIGRFFRQLHAKRQDVLIESFINLRGTLVSESKDWKLVLIGGVEDQNYVDQLKKKAKGHPIEFYHDLDREGVENLLHRSSIYWHATGFNIDESLEPEKVEHFGISTIEAMAAGLVPVVINKGGQPEILSDQLSLLLWNTAKELTAITAKVMANDDVRNQLAKKAQKRASFYSKSRFDLALREMLE